MIYLQAGQRFSKKQGISIWKQTNPVKEAKYFCAALVNGENKSAPCACKFLQCNHHQKCRDTEQNKIIYFI